MTTMHLSTIIPSGNGGINKEGRTLGEIALAPVPEALLARIESLRIDTATSKLSPTTYIATNNSTPTKAT